MAGLQSRIGNPEVKFVSLTTDPLFDTPPVLKKYAERFGVQDQRWFFLTGPPQELHDFSVKSLKFVVLEKKESEREEPQDLFVHSLRFAVVDKKGQIRGWVDGEEPDMESKIANLVQQLSGETQ
jgi:cytochrome oxidase Cu insertion factor (SCO1/SenC/PrrC family)